MGWSGPSNVSPVVTPGSWKSALALAPPNDRTLAANGDKQYYWDPGGAYTAYVQKSSGLLTIRANSVANTVSNPGGLPYNSGAIVSAIRTGSSPAAGFFSFTNGYVEISAKLPKGNGTFPSVMLQALADTNYEIDLVQAHGSNATVVLQTIRYSASDSLQIQALSASAVASGARQVKTTVADYSAAFHTYGVDKQADFITWYVDRVPVASYPASGIPVRPYYIIMSLAMGGNGDVDPDATTPLPADFDIDYVVVWPNAAAAGITPPPTPTPTPTPTPSGKTRVVAPLTGTVTAGTWITNQSFAAPMPGGGNVLRYNINYPQGYSRTGNTIWPVVFLGHENDQGMNGSVYPRDGGTLCAGLDMAIAMNTVAARTRYPAIYVLPQVDQTLDLSGANGNANGGGYNDSPMSGQNEQAITALAKYILANEAADPTRFYIIGASLGGIWMLAQMVDNNRINGPFNKLWTAGMSMSDQLFRPSVPNSSVFARMLNVPIIAVSTNSDNNPNSYDRPAYNTYIGNSGNSTYPSKTQYDSTGISALKAGSSQFYYLDAVSGAPWTTYSYLNADGGDGTRLLDLLFSFII